MSGNSHSNQASVGTNQELSKCIYYMSLLLHSSISQYPNGHTAINSRKIKRLFYTAIKSYYGIDDTGKTEERKCG